MDRTIPSELVKGLRDRRTLLWVCQRHDLVEGEEPHDWDVPSSTALLRYRDGPNENDRKLAELYWESVWLEGAASPILKAIRQVSDGQPVTRRRQVVVLAGTADAQARVPSEEFLPVCVLPGLLDKNASADAQYGALRSRARERAAFDLAARMREYRGRAIVVIGARTNDDLSRIYEVLEDSPVVDLRLILVWPEGVELPDGPSNSAVEFNVWSGTEDDFISALVAESAPTAGDLQRWTIRVGKRTITLPAKEVHRVVDRFALITEKDLLPAETFTINDLHDFLGGNLDNWTAYTSGLPVKRAYASGANHSLTEELKSALDHVNDENQRTFVLQVPCQSGAGATTLLRAAAFAAAVDGYPTLICRPEEVDLNLDDLVAFTTALSETALSEGIKDFPPFVIVFDVEHESIKAANQTAQTLASHGRRAVVLQAVEGGEPALEEKRTKRFVRLSPLKSQTTPQEVELCARSFHEIAKRWNLALEIPSLDHWRTYESRTSFLAPAGQQEAASMFWIALKFFLTEGADFSTRDRIEDALGAWMRKRIPDNPDSRILDFVSYVAAFSSYRIVSPIWTVLRPVTGGSFSSQFLDVVHALKDMIVWGDSSEELGDQVLRFAHPSLASEFLRQHGVRTAKDRALVVRPVLSALSAGHLGDVWLSESFAAMVLVPPRDERQFAEWDWRLGLFEVFPPVVRDQSKTILHHWGRCLYLSADTRVMPAIPDDERKRRLETAIEKLKKAVNLPRRSGRDEHPSHLFNTLGTAYTRYANFLEQAGAGDASISAWDEACRAFDQSIELSPGTNMEALLAYSWQLLKHAGKNTPGDPAAARRKTNDVAKALSYLDDAEEILREHAAPNPSWSEDLAQYRTQALSWLNDEAGLDYLRELQRSNSPELGYYCEARLVLSRGRNDESRTNALRVLEQAEAKGVRLQPRSLLLRLSLLRDDPTKRFDFPLLLKQHEELERSPGYVLRPGDAFRHAVLCYQVGDFAEGADRFRRLRESARQAESAPPRMRDQWRASEDPERARRTNIRVTRIRALQCCQNLSSAPLGRTVK